MQKIELAEELIAERKRRGLSISKLAPQIGVSKSTLSYWELGSRRPSLEHAILWANSLGYRLCLMKDVA